MKKNSPMKLWPLTISLLALAATPAVAADSTKSAIDAWKWAAGAQSGLSLVEGHLGDNLTAGYEVQLFGQTWHEKLPFVKAELQIGYSQHWIKQNRGSFYRTPWSLSAIGVLPWDKVLPSAPIWLPRPYARVGAGAVASFAQQSNNVLPLVVTGLGIEQPLGKSVEPLAFVRAEVTHSMQFETHRMGNFTVFNLGVAFQFPSMSEEVVVAQSLPTIEPVVVAKRLNCVVAPFDAGCPDGDKDGVLDARDECPAEPEDKNGKSDDDGCPDNDMDNDGIIDIHDRCMQIPGTAKNGRSGCPKYVDVNFERGTITVLQSIRFGDNGARILESSYRVLNDVMLVLRSHPEFKRVRVEGHTDNRGRSDYNMLMSQLRANSVVRWLVDRGVAPTRLESIGCGKNRPLQSNSTMEGRELNRRVEFHVLDPVPVAGPRSTEGCQDPD